MLTTLKKLLKAIIPESFLRKYYPYRWQLHNCLVLAREYNQLESMQKWQCLDKSGAPLAWITYPCLEYLEGLDFSHKQILEWGGYSSLYWGERAESVVSIESDKKWHASICPKVLPHNAMYLKTQIHAADAANDYARFPLGLGKKFDVIVIDGGDIDGINTRLPCAKVALELLNTSAPQGAMIIVDNADWHSGVTRFLRESGLIQVDFSGFGPINCYTWSTSIFLTRNFAFMPKLLKQPLYSKDALHFEYDKE